MVLNLTVYLSNQLEFLYQVFKIRVFENKNPFARRLVIVPSQAIKSWLMLQMADDPHLKIATGMEVCYLDQALSKMYEEVYRTPFRKFPSKLTLSFKIEALFLDQFQTDDAAWDPVKDYVLWSKSNFPLKGHRRLVSLSDQLASLFSSYALYGQKMTQSWKNDEKGSWQIRLWNLLDLPKNEAQEGIYRPLEVYLFALSFIPQSSFSLLEQLAKYVKIQSFQLSPCEFFWTDLLSDKEGLWLLKQSEKKNINQGSREKLEELLMDKNPLLANLGRLGREIMWQMEESGAELFGQYSLPESCQRFIQYDHASKETFYVPSSSLNVLQATQADILLLRNPAAEEKIQLDSQDRSIQIHVAPTKMREVQILYDRCLEIMDKHSSQILSKDILVMAPDIMEYVPFIKAIFGSSSSVLDFQIMDLSAPSQNHSVQLFLKILGLAEGKWDSLTLFELLDYSFFCEKHQFTNEEVDQLKKWFLQTNLSWGLDSKHRQSVLKKDYEVDTDPVDAGTWDFAFARLLKSLALDSHLIEGNFNVDQTQAILLGRWIRLLRTLNENLKCFSDERSLTLEDWVDYLQKLCQDYIFSSEEDISPLECVFQELVFAGKHQKSVFPFPSVKKRIEHLLEQQQLIFRETHLHSVKFCSLLPMRAIPAKVIALMGMNEDAFPKVETKVSLDLLNAYEERDYRPTKTDYDRYLFLEALISAREYLLISYLNYSNADPKPQPPSLLVSELIVYLDQSYLLGDKKFSEINIFKHPFYAFDSSYFEEGALIKSFSRADYLCAKACVEEKEKSHQFIKQFNYLPFTCQEKRMIELKELIKFGKNPLRSYFNQTLKIFLREEEEFQREDSLTVSHLSLYDLRKMGLKYSSKQVIEASRKKGELPQGIFEDIAISKIDEEIQSLESNLQNFMIDKQTLFKIHMIENCSSCHEEKSHWEVPPLMIETDDYSVSLIGDFSMVSRQGLLSLSKDTRQDFAKVYPEFLVFSVLVETFNLPIDNQLLMLRSGKIHTIKEPLNLLKKFITYYLTSLQTPSPLIPEWIYDFIRENQQNCQSFVEGKMKENKQLYNEYLQWISRQPSVQIAGVDPAWKKYAHEIYEEVMEEWYPSRSTAKAFEEKE